MLLSCGNAKKNRGSKCTHEHFGLSPCFCLHPQCPCSTSQLQSKCNYRQLRIRCSNTAVVHILNRQSICVPSKNKPSWLFLPLVFSSSCGGMASVHRKPWLFVLSALAVCLASTVCFIQSLNDSAFDKRGLKEFLTVFSVFYTLVKLIFFCFSFFCSWNWLFKTSRQELHQIAQHQRRHRRQELTKTTSTIWVLQVGFRGC